MKFYIYDKKIRSKSLIALVGDCFYSNIRLGKHSLEDKLNKDLKVDLTKIYSVDDIELDSNQEFIALSSNISFFDSKLAEIFIKTLQFSSIDYIYEGTSSFIFKGNKSTFKYFLEGNETKIPKTKINHNFIELNSVYDLKKIAAKNFHSRHFNSIRKKDDLIIKKSENKKKLKDEFLFLKSIPSNLKDFYAEPINEKETSNDYEYSLKAYDMFDLGYQHISGLLDLDDIKGLFRALNDFYLQVFKTRRDSDGRELDDILTKNSLRYEESKKLDLYSSLNQFMVNHSGISFNDHYLRIQATLKSYKKNFKNSGKIFSHGDLCFSNILFSPETLEFKLIDPRGLDNSDGFRTPYYDMAKLSHSLLGNYDFIVNNLCKIEFTDHMEASNKFNLNSDSNYDAIFRTFLKSFQLDYKLVRVIESSLFLSMLPLHIDNTKKVYSLALRSVEIYNEVNETK